MSNDNINALSIGTQLQEFRIDAVLGNGSFGITYLAYDTSLQCQVVIKEYFPNALAVREEQSTVSPYSGSAHDVYVKGMERFLQEAQVLSQFDHPNIVKVKRLFQANNTAYFVMDYAEGEDFSDYLKRLGRPMREDELLSIIMPILDGLRELHNKGYYHRDIKPGNIYIRKSGTPMLIDFGAAKQVAMQETHKKGDEEKHSSFNAQTPAYAAPEQESGISSLIGPHTDHFAIGATMYRAISGKHPVYAKDRSVAVTQMDHDPYESITTKVNTENYSPHLLATIDQCLAFKSIERPQSAKEVQELLMGRGTVPTPNPEPEKPQPPQEKKSKVVALLLGMVAVIALSLGGYYVVNGKDTPKIQETAQVEKKQVVEQVKEVQKTVDYKIEKKKSKVERLAQETNFIYVDPNTSAIWMDNEENVMVIDDWNTSIKYCENLEFAGYSNWTLPTIEQLEALHKQKDKLRKYSTRDYWSSTSSKSIQSNIMVVNFLLSYSVGISDPKEEQNSVRCVTEGDQAGNIEPVEPIVEAPGEIHSNKGGDIAPVEPVVERPTFPEPVKLVSTPWPRPFQDSELQNRLTPPMKKLKLIQLSKKKVNRDFHEEKEWFYKYGLNSKHRQFGYPSFGFYKDNVVDVVKKYKDYKISTAFTDGTLMLTYNEDKNYGDFRYLFGGFDINEKRKLFSKYGFDFRDFNIIRVGFSIEKNNMLYISVQERVSSGPMSIVAIDLKNNEIKWQSKAFAGSAENYFDIVDDYIIASEGGTGFPDYLVVINRLTGEIVQKYKLDTAAGYIIYSNNKLYVLTYNMEYIFGIKLSSEKDYIPPLDPSKQMINDVKKFYEKYKDSSIAPVEPVGVN